MSPARADSSSQSISAGRGEAERVDEKVGAAAEEEGEHSRVVPIDDVRSRTGNREVIGHS